MLTLVVSPLLAQNESGLPTNAKAQKSYREGMNYVDRHMLLAALDSFKNADKQDGRHCAACQQQIIKYGIQLQDWKSAETAASQMIDEAGSAKSLADAHYVLGIVLMDEGLNKHKEEPFERAHEEMNKALAADANFPEAVFQDALSLAHANQDAAAKAQFERYLNMVPASDPKRQRALRFIRQPDLARGRIAPAFTVTALDGQRVSLDDLNGKVVLIDFWATWCPPCREALPHIQSIARKFQGQPLVILSVSLDADDKKWKAFVAHNDMTWLNYRDGGFDGPLATLFDVHAIPHTFTIDADGMLQSEAVGDSAMEGKLKKLIARAVEVQTEASTKP
jgi:thiol-disulfide isomerase/thioredoxin